MGPLLCSWTRFAADRLKPGDVDDEWSARHLRDPQVTRCPGRRTAPLRPGSTGSPVPFVTGLVEAPATTPVRSGVT